MSFGRRMRASSVTVVLLLLSCGLSGCMGSSDKEERPYPSIWDRSDFEWDTSGTFSRVLEAGPYYALEVKEAMVCLLYTSDAADEE